ncbi:MAG TPA: glycosyltransferase [Thermoanaerobaculia bacterium]|nr:glycosyltransferase [Thermoanaerobaculia bacterium]
MSTVDVVVPVYNEGENIERALRELSRVLPSPSRILVVYDFDEDDTIPVVMRLRRELAQVELVRNRRGRGVPHAIRSGLDAATGDVVIVSMADLSDDVGVIPDMVRLIRSEGYDVVCASRYMPGGKQIGGPWLKRTFSRLAGVSLHAFGYPVHDVTNSFRAYRRSILVQIGIESLAGFACSLEVLAKAVAAGHRVAEVPSTWRDRSAGRSQFRLWKWLPEYVRWYWYALTHRP